MLVLGSVGSSSYARSSYKRHRDRFKEASGFDFKFLSNPNLIKFGSSEGFFFFFISIFSPKATTIFNFYIKHIAICMYNILKC